ncbi:MAG: GNAT family N-acetyltransferase [Pseudomonadales bacterium]|nr:GNAT family N-acetyltransferase [Pseudomonadales bacterium]NRA13867.1 GNAT family N-acetyltransferase [Oceanospirillaceae bacterium]
MQLSYRAATLEDVDFLLQLRIDTMAEYMRSVGWPTDNETHRRRIMYKFEQSQIIFYEDERVGFLKAYADPDCWHLVQVQVGREFQGRGIGGRAVGKIITRATADKKDVALTVIVGNPAKALYSRLGFKALDIVDDEEQMRYYYQPL